MPQVQDERHNLADGRSVSVRQDVAEDEESPGQDRRHDGHQGSERIPIADRIGDQWLCTRSSRSTRIIVTTEDYLDRIEVRVEFSDASLLDDYNKLEQLRAKIRHKHKISAQHRCQDHARNAGNAAEI